MNIIKYANVIFLFIIFPLYGCKKINNLNELDTNSYINDFNLIQENPKNKSILKISSPRAIIDPAYDDIKIFNGTIDIINKDGQDVQVKSGNSTLKNSSNMIHIYNNVNISLVDSKKFFILTHSFDWDLSTSKIDLNNKLLINFDDTKIYSSNGSYDINSNSLFINNNIFDRSIYNVKGEKLYNIKILSDKAKWSKHENSIEFTSPNKQVETTIDFLSTKLSE
tara:strand:+ start:88 stop:756 length:669 start_codon:yes stop_codon:yes gene_type:complete